MLQRLTVQNYALIDELDVAFGPQLNLLTGETGAGKSLLVGAIGLILGERADSSVMLDPEQKLVVEAHFAQPKALNLAPWAEEAAVELDGELLIIRREINTSGKSRAFVNDSPVTLTVLRELTSQLVDLHGQHEGQALMKPAEQLATLDQYGGLLPLSQDFAQQLDELKACQQQLDALRQRAEADKQQLDYLSFQVQAFREADLQPGEDDALEADLKRLEHAEDIAQGLAASLAALTESEQPLRDQLATVMQQLNKLMSYDEALKPVVEHLQEAISNVEDAADKGQRLAEELAHDPERLEEISQRLDVINKLKLKFQKSTVQDLLALQEEFEEQLAGIEGIDDELARLESRRQQLAAQLLQTGLDLEKKRQAVAEELAEAIEGVLHRVGLPKASFSIALSRLEAEEGPLEHEGARLQPNRAGINKVQFNIQTNAGLPLGPLNKLASGGELSRVMLAIKTALASRLALSVLIFDEIDTGISGQVALQVGQVMEQLAERHQVLSITHLPQIASRQGAHFRLYKTEQNGRAHTRISKLEGAARVQEVAAIMSGAEPSETALRSAEELLAS